MNYEEMSDFEINKAVHFKMIVSGKVKERYRLNDADFVDVYRNEFGENAGPSVIAVMRYVRDGIPDGYNPFGGAFDYCNNPSDAWQIILENRINVYASEGPDFMPWMAGCGGVMVSNKNPLRAAMIVFLMMQEQGK